MKEENTLTAKEWLVSKLGNPGGKYTEEQEINIWMIYLYFFIIAACFALIQLHIAILHHPIQQLYIPLQPDFKPKHTTNA